MLFLRYYLWVAPHLLLGLILLRSLRQGLYKQLPIFFGFVVFELAQFLALFTLSLLLVPPSINPYRWAVVFGLAISTCLELAVIYELANDLLLSRSSLAGVLRPLLRWGTAVLLLLAAIASGTLPGVSVQRVMHIFQVLDFTSSLLRTGLLLSLFLFSRALHISWRSWPTGVALGFGISACVELATAALRAEFGSGGFIAVDVTQLAAFHVCVVIWLVYLFLPQRASQFVGRGLGKSELEFWDQELQRMVRR